MSPHHPRSPTGCPPCLTGMSPATLGPPGMSPPPRSPPWGRARRPPPHSPLAAPRPGPAGSARCRRRWRTDGATEGPRAGPGEESRRPVPGPAAPAARGCPPLASGSPVPRPPPPVPRSPSTHGQGARDTPHLGVCPFPPQVCWLAPEQTAGKQKPYMYTQGQAVLNRSFFPCFDTPSVKCTYSATVQVPEGFTAVMSATSSEKQKDNTFVFKMSQPIPSYLIALAVGDIVSADVGPRSRVWAEPCLIEAAKKEYDGVIEEFLAVGEKLFGPYVWGRYDILFMPPSFPFGGMENPCLTFVTPCLLAGDRSLADVIIHEISHSWFGNLVTNASWGEFWLNEGFTMYAQRRISTEVYGLAYTCLEAATGRALLRQHMDNTGEDHPLNKLRVVIEPGVNPDDTYNETPYEKGYCFVSYLAHLVGDQSKFDAFLQAYVNQFKFQSITADDTLGFFLEYFPELKEKGVDSIPGFEFDRWLNTPGWPPYLPDLSPGEQLMKPADELAQLWAADSLNVEAIEAVDITAWRTYQLVYFLDKVLEKSPLPEGNVERLSKMYPKISKAQNAELRLRWCQIVLKNNLEAEYSKVKDFLHSQGKQKYTLPLYRAMWGGSEVARALAMETFSATAPQLHVNVQNYVKKILGLEGAED
uniref:Arginyl aminopeptidase n=1 Tax=Calidris pygmaea TaxID=425635 RepID=A0A8C3JXR4_9CHAR